jgi:hypothetical protein
MDSRARTARRELLPGALGTAALLLVAAVSFWMSGERRGDSTLQALGITFVAIAAATLSLGAYVSRGD